MTKHSFFDEDFLVYVRIPSGMTMRDLQSIDEICFAHKLSKGPNTNHTQNADGIDVVSSPEISRRKCSDELYESQISPESQWNMKISDASSPEHKSGSSIQCSQEQNNVYIPGTSPVEYVQSRFSSEFPSPSDSQVSVDDNQVASLSPDVDGEDFHAAICGLSIHSPNNLPPVISPLGIHFTPPKSGRLQASSYKRQLRSSLYKSPISNYDNSQDDEVEDLPQMALTRRGTHDRHSLRSLQPLALRMKTTVSNRRPINTNNTNRMPSVENTSQSFKLKHIHDELVVWLRDHASHAIVTTQSTGRKTVISTIIQDSSAIDRDKRIRILHKDRELYGGTLILTSKARLEEWAGVVRSCPSLSLHVYTDSLNKRKKLGAQHLVSYDVVVTTVEFSHASSVASTPYKNDHFQEGFFAVPWMSPKYELHANIERSNLHLLRWNRIILDVDAKTKVQLGTAKGDAIRCLSASSKFGVFTLPPEDKENSMVLGPNVSQILNVREVLGVPSAQSIESTIFQMS
eukprot:gene6362-12863_t